MSRAQTVSRRVRDLLLSKTTWSVATKGAGAGGGPLVVSVSNAAAAECSGSTLRRLLFSTQATSREFHSKGLSRLRNAAVVGSVAAGALYMYTSSQYQDRAHQIRLTSQNTVGVDNVSGLAGADHDVSGNVLSTLFTQAKHQALLLKRFVELSFIFLPAILLSPMYLYMNDDWKDRWFVVLKRCLEKAGPAFLKWGQWAATRPDLFSPDVCSTFQLLQTDAPKHEFEYTRATVEQSFGRSLEELFVEFDKTPVASGSIAQVHRAVLSDLGARIALGEGEKAQGLFNSLVTLSTDRSRREMTAFAKGSTVAVKVRHPGVGRLIDLDFELMNCFASFAEKLTRIANKGKSSLLSAQLKESLMQFGAPMKEQLDLRSEAAHLDDFAENFKWWSQVRFPLPALGMVTEDVLVETFESGDHISSYLGKQSEHNHTLANLGLTCYLKMLLNDNFIHADLHPGNILVHLDKPSNGSLLAVISEKTGWQIEIPRIVLLDVGMTTRLSDTEQSNLVSFFQSLTSLDGNKIAESILSFAEAVEDATGFKNEMNALFAALEPEQLRKNTQEVIGNMMDTIREHNIQIPGVVSNVIISTVVLEGWSSKLNPDIRILESLKEFLPAAWEERMKKLVEKGHGGFAE